MMDHVKYLSYLVRHKYYVAIECFKRGLIWRGLVHDISKLRSSEWFPYVEYFCTNRKRSETMQDRFDMAWLLHQRRNPHHWQCWILREDDGDTKVLPMPQIYLTEMLCDWIGAGKAQGKSDAKGWYLLNRDKIVLHPVSREWIEKQLLSTCGEAGDTGAVK